MKKILQGIQYRILKKLKKEIVIPSYEVKRAIIDGYRNEFEIELFVETGTFLGDTVDYFKNKFEKVYSIELSEELANKAIKRFKEVKKVQIIQGDSGTVLHDLVNQFKRPAIFWLDGHYSSEFFLGDEYIKTARADKDTPVENELKAIFRSSIPHIILIDDARLFKGENDYPTIDELRKLVKESKPGYKLTVGDDIIRIVPNSDNSGNWISKEGSINKKYISKFLPKNPVIIDAGAHRGDDSVELCKLIPSAQIHAFEPVPAIFNDLKSNAVGYPQIKCYNLALSNKTGEQEMHISSGGSDASSSLLAPDEHLKDHPDTYFNETIKVKTIKLDDWAQSNSIDKVDFMWLDMQGFELEVLKASKVVLQKTTAIHMEVSTRQTYKDVPLYDEVKKWMSSNGFKVCIEEIPKGWDMGNVLFVKEHNV